MKQYINVTQLKSLSSDKLKKLCSLAFNPFLQRVAFEKEFNFTVDDSCLIEASRFITIGIMIQILESYDNDYIKCIFKTPDKEWSCCTDDDYEGYTRSHKELCDELWEVVKNIL